MPRLAARRLRAVTGATLVAAALGASTLGLPAAVAQPSSQIPTSQIPTGEARRAGVQPGNAQMGWRTRQLESSRLRAQAFTPTGVLGIDVSSHQGKVNWSSWRKKGRTFAYVKATEGTSYRNPYFSSQYNGSAKAGMIRGAYHFANPAGKSGVAQARYFVANGGGWTADGRTLPGVLDIEYNPYGSTCYGVGKTKMVAWIKAFTVEYKRLTTRDALIYTTADWWNRCTGNTTKFSKTNPLWAARYGTETAGQLPGSWKVATFWQYTSSPIDQNQFSSTPERLKVLATGVAPVSPAGK